MFKSSTIQKSVIRRERVMYFWHINNSNNKYLYSAFLWNNSRPFIKSSSYKIYIIHILYITCILVHGGCGLWSVLAVSIFKKDTGIVDGLDRISGMVRVPDSLLNKNIQLYRRNVCNYYNYLYTWIITNNNILSIIVWLFNRKVDLSKKVEKKNLQNKI